MEMRNGYSSWVMMFLSVLWSSLACIVYPSLFIPTFIILLSSFSESNTITIWNNGKGIPVVEHKDEKMYVPALIFGHLLTSSNYDDEQKKVTGDKITLKTRILIIVHLCNTISYGFDKASDRMSNLNHFYCLLLWSQLNSFLAPLAVLSNTTLEWENDYSSSRTISP